MILARALHDELLAHARAEAPLECCGVIAGRQGVPLLTYPATNAEHSETRYEIDGPESMEILRDIAERDLELWGIYHSHVLGPAYPSEADVAGAFYPEVLYVIVGLAEDVVRAFRIRDGEVTEEALEIG